MKIPMRIYLVGGCALLVTSVVSAYVLLNPTRTWQNPPMPYIVDARGVGSIADGDGGKTATINAITSEDAWNGADPDTEASDVVEAIAGDVENNWGLGDNVPMLNFEDPTDLCTGNCLAGTFTGFYERVGRGRSRKTVITDADIVTNTAFSWTSESEDPGGVGCSGEFYIEGVHVHEIGHGLGLGHTDVSGATMFPSIAACDNDPATTEADDEAGLCALYGCDGGSSSCALLPAGDSCDSNSECCSGKCRGKPENQSCR